ncbi:MAG: DnaB-like helicase N-terminal domain-containing protein, partial [Opitutus sp.]
MSPVRPYTPAPAALGRTLPHSIEAEEYLLGSVFADSSGGSDVLARCESAGVSAESFYDARHGILFGCMADLHRRGLAVEPATIAEELKRTRQLDAVGGYSFLVQVSGRIPTTAQAAYFIDKVREQQILRDLIRAGTGIVENCYTHSGGEIETLIESTERQMHRICQGHAFGEVWEYRSIADFSMPPADDPDALLGKYRFLCRGGGLVIVGPTSIGKSSLE